ncbi:Gfo/Idh/MocA family oxidoreductase [Phenylobacterium sp. LjRoot219]|uniref:Gfo/Idh/MocA family protein n=1 Tax=Phenylobacterium sp. LjRoot219 TaxID=3342283 RepID=UPI003ECF6EB4
MTSSTAPRAVVVGTSFGCRIQVPALRAAGFEVAGLVGTDPERTARRAEKAGVARTFTDLDEAIAKTGAVAVTIATPPTTHAPLTLAAVARGCHVICEKPFARDVAEAKTMQAAATRAGVMALVGNEFRWLPDRALVARAIAEGLIGEPRFVTMANYIPLVAAPDAKMPRWWFDEAAGGGWLGAQGAHIIDQVRSWLGDFASLSAALPTVSDRQGAAEDSYVMRFRLKNGVEGALQQTAGAWGPSDTMTRVAGTHGTLWVDGADVWLADREGKRQLPVTPDLQLPPPPPQSDAPGHQFSHFELGPYIRLAEALRAGVDGRDPQSAVPLPTFADGVAAMQVIDAVRASAAQGGALVEL